MTIMRNKAWHIENLIQADPDCQVVELYVAEELESSYLAQIEMNNSTYERAQVLLQATLDILKECHDGPYVKDVLSTTAIWDGVECDGRCLMEEIECLLQVLGG